MSGTKYKIRATIPAGLVREVEQTFGITLTKNQIGNAAGSWEVPLEELQKTIEHLESMGIHDFILEKSGIQFNIAVQRESLAEMQQALMPYVAGTFNRYNDPFADGQVFSFVVLTQYAEAVHEILMKYNVVRFIGLECFTILEDRPDV